MKKIEYQEMQTAMQYYLNADAYQEELTHAVSISCTHKGSEHEQSQMCV